MSAALAALTVSLALAASPGVFSVPGEKDPPAAGLPRERHGSAAPSGVSITAFAGAGYLLDTAERPGTFSARSLFDFTAGLSVNGGFIRPQLLQWSASVAYLGNRQTVHQGAARALDSLIFGARVSLLSGTPTTLSLFATRANTWATELSPRRSTGTSVTTGFGGSAAVAFLDYPRLTFSLARNIIETTRGDGSQTSSGLTTLRLGVNQQLKRLEYSGSYATNWSSGTFTDLQYGSHEATVRAAAPLTPALQLVVNDQYFVRLPTAQAPTNPRYETNSFASLLTWRRSERLTAALNYNNLQSGISAPGGLDLTTSSHSLSESLQWKWRDDVIITEQLGAQYASSRTGTDQFKGGRGDLGAGFTWLRPAWGGGTSLGAGASIGLAGDDAAPVTPTWGAHLDAQLSGRYGRLSGSGLYSLVYADTGTRLFGRTFRQNLRLEAIFLPAPSWRLRAFFSGYGARKDDAVIGTALQRSLQANLEASYRQHHLLLFGGYSDGLPESLGNPVFADGLFLPAPYNSQLVNAGATLSTAPLPRLNLRATARFTQTSGLGRPTEQELGLTFTAGWTIGRFTLSAEDRLVLGSLDSFWYRNNTVMVRLTRDFDWRF